MNNKSLLPEPNVVLNPFLWPERKEQLHYHRMATTPIFKGLLRLISKNRVCTCRNKRRTDVKVRRSSSHREARAHYQDSAGMIWRII